MFVFCFFIFVLPCKRKTLYRKSCNLFLFLVTSSTKMKIEKRKMGWKAHKSLSLWFLLSIIPLINNLDCADGSQNQTGQPNLDKRLRQYSAYELNRKKLPKNSQINKTSLQSQRSSLQLSQSKNQIPPRDHHHHTQ